MLRSENFDRRLLVSVDVKGYGGRDDLQRSAVQRGLLAVLDEAAAEARLSREDWDKQPGGDGELAVLPASEPEPRVVDDFVRELRVALDRYNHDLRPETRLRLRLAIHYGVAIPEANGYTGDGIIEVSRMVDSPQLHAPLEESDAVLAVMVSQRIFEETVIQRHTSLRASDFRQVDVRNKEYVKPAWLYVPGVDVHSLDLAERTSTAGAEEAPAAKAGSAEGTSGTGPADVGTVINSFYGNVNAQDSTIGISQH